VTEPTKRTTPAARVESLRENLDRVEVLSRLEASVIVLGASELAHELHLRPEGRGRTALSPLSLRVARSPGRQAGRSGLSLAFEEAADEDSPRYWAPEARDEDKSIDEVADVWSLALVCFEALAGVRPHEPPWSPDRARLYQLRPDAGRGLDALLHRCLSADPSERSPSLQAFADDFLAALASPRGPGSGAGGPSRVQIIVAVAAAVFALLAVLTLGDRTPLVEPPKPSANPARVPLWVEPPVVSSGSSVPREAPSGR
jgi:hypothetical protein